MEPTGDHEAAARSAAGRRLVESLHRRAEFEEALGVLQGGRQYTAAEAREELVREHDQQVGDEESEAARVRAAVDADSVDGGDPDMFGPDD